MKRITSLLLLCMLMASTALALLTQRLKPARLGVEQHDIVIVNQAKDIVVLSQFQLADAVGGHRQTVAVSGFERNETVTVKAVQTIVRSDPYHTRTVLQRARRVPMAQTVRVIVEPQRIVLGRYPKTEY